MIQFRINHTDNNVGIGVESSDDEEWEQMPPSPPPHRELEYDNTVHIVMKEKYTFSELRNLSNLLNKMIVERPRNVD